MRTLIGILCLLDLAVASRFRLRSRYWRWRWETAAGGPPRDRRAGDADRGPPHPATTLRGRIHAALEFARWIGDMRRL